MGITATGKAVTTTGITLLRIENGKIAECIYVAATEEGEMVGVAVGCPAALGSRSNAAEVSAPMFIRLRKDRG